MEIRDLRVLRVIQGLGGKQVKREKQDFKVSREQQVIEE
jgi:hypothetical protein